MYLGIYTIRTVPNLPVVIGTNGMNAHLLGLPRYLQEGMQLAFRVFEVPATGIHCLREIGSSILMEMKAGKAKKKVVKNTCKCTGLLRTT